jgi:hypothetical protein
MGIVPSGRTYGCVDQGEHPQWITAIHYPCVHGTVLRVWNDPDPW